MTDLFKFSIGSIKMCRFACIQLVLSNRVTTVAITGNKSYLLRFKMEIIYTSFIHYSQIVLSSRVRAGVRTDKAQVHAPDFQIGRGNKMHSSKS